MTNIKALLLLNSEDIRVKYDDSNERFNKKIMNSNLNKNPYSIIIGAKERDNNLISFRKYNSEETVSMSIQEFIKYIKEEIKKDNCIILKKVKLCII